MKATTRRASRAGKIGSRPRGWGQARWVDGCGYQWPNGRSSCDFRWDDSLCGQLRHAIAFHCRSSHDIAAAAGIEPTAIDRFMQGDDNAISFADASTVARLVGHRLQDQSIIDGLLTVWENTGEPSLSVPRCNRLERRAWRQAGRA